MNVDELIKVESLPKIFYQLEMIGSEVDKALDGIENMECTDENKSEVKKRKQEITAFKNVMETRRKEIKAQILEKYDEFNKKYELEVKSKLENAENILKEKYTKIEQEQLDKKREEIQLFAVEHIKANELQDIITYDDINLNITLSVSMKSLKEQVLNFCETIKNDLKLIEMEEYKDEILIEYKKNLMFAKSKMVVVERHKQLEELAKKQELVEEHKEIKKLNDENQDEIVEIVSVESTIENNNLITIKFSVTGTIEQMRKLKQFLKDENIKYN